MVCPVHLTTKSNFFDRGEKMSGVIDASARAAYWKLEEWHKTVQKEKGIILELFDLVLALFETIKNEAGASSVEILATDLFTKFLTLHNIFKAEPFGAPRDNDALEQIGLEIMQLRSDVTAQEELLVTIDQLETRLTKQAGAETTIAELRAKLQQTEQGKTETTLPEADLKLQKELAAANQRYANLFAALQKAMEHIVPFLPQQEKLVDVLPIPPTQPTPEFCGAIDRVEKAIEKWTLWLEEIGEQIIDLQARIDEHEAKIAQIRDSGRFGNGKAESIKKEAARLSAQVARLNEHQQKLLELKHQGQEQVRKFRQLIDSVREIQTGINENALVPPEIPEQVNTREIVESPVYETPLTMPSRVDGQDAAASVAYCKMIADQRQLPIEVVLELSLFDLVPKTESGQTQKKGNSKVIRIATSVGMLERFGISTIGDFFRNWNREKVDMALPWLPKNGVCGREGKTYPMYRRNTVPLPWNPRSLFSDAEIAVFQELIEVPSEPAKKKQPK